LIILILIGADGLGLGIIKSRFRLEPISGKIDQKLVVLTVKWLLSHTVPRRQEHLVKSKMIIVKMSHSCENFCQCGIKAFRQVLNSVIFPIKSNLILNFTGQQESSPPPSPERINDER